jgi:hypothetical protein
MPRRLALAALVLCALPSPALANPSISTSASASGALNRLPATVSHRLTLTAGTTEEKVGISTSGSMTVSGAGVTVDENTGVGSSVERCAGRWQHLHLAHGDVGRFSVKITIAPLATATIDVPITFAHAPWAADSLDAIWSITPAQGAGFDVVSRAPFYDGPMGVHLRFTLTRLARRVYSVAGTAASGVDSGRVQLWGYAPGRNKARRLAVARVHGGAWRIHRLRLPRAGTWEFYARYRTAGKAFANDASQCGTIAGVH